jgi:hypothetical protein
MANNKVQKRKYVIGLLVLLAMATVSTYAWSTDETLTTDPSTVYVTSNPGTTTTIGSYSSKPLGKNKIEIKFTSAVAVADIDFMFIDSTGDIIPSGATVKIDGGAAIVANADGTYSKAALAIGAHTITVEGSGVWKDIGSAGGTQTFNGLMLVIK